MHRDKSWLDMCGKTFLLYGQIGFWQKEKDCQDVENSFTSRHQTLSNFSLPGSRPHSAMGTSLTRGLLGLFIPPPSPSYEPCRPFQCTLKWTPRGPDPRGPKGLLPVPGLPPGFWSPIGPVPPLYIFSPAKLYPIQQDQHGTLPVKAWMLEDSEARGIICGVERGEEEGRGEIASFASQISSWWMTPTSPPRLWYLLQHIFTACCMNFLQKWTKTMFQLCRSNGTSHNCQLLDLWIYIGRGDCFHDTAFHGLLVLVKPCVLGEPLRDFTTLQFQTILKLTWKLLPQIYWPQINGSWPE